MQALTLPTYLTLARMGLAVLVVVALLYFPTAAGAWTAAVLFAVASVLDFLDGYLARRLGQESDLGRMLDPISDKVLVIAGLAAVMVRSEHVLWLMPPFLVIVFREFLIAGLREYLANVETALPSSIVAKYKTSVQLLAVLVLLVAEAGTESRELDMSGWDGLSLLGAGLLWVAAILTVISGVGYLRGTIGKGKGTFRQ